MPIKTPRTKAAKKRVMRTELKRFKAGKLHSGKGGKVVKSKKQAVAIALSASKQSKRKK
jgi:hypothetical protein